MALIEVQLELLRGLAADDSNDGRSYIKTLVPELINELLQLRRNQLSWSQTTTLTDGTQEIKIWQGEENEHPVFFHRCCSKTTLKGD